MQSLSPFKLAAKALPLRLGHKPGYGVVRGGKRNTGRARGNIRALYNLKCARVASDLASGHAVHCKGENNAAKPR